MPVKRARRCARTGAPRDRRRGSPSRRRDVAGELAGVGEDGVVADLAVVRDVHVGHDPVVVAEARDARVLHRAAVDRAVLADRVAVADLDRGGLAGVLLVLRRRRRARRTGRCGCCAPMRVRPSMHHVRADPRCRRRSRRAAPMIEYGADRDAGARAARPGGRSRSDGSSPSIGARRGRASCTGSSPRATSRSPTRAAQSNFQMPRCGAIELAPRASAGRRAPPAA